MSAETDPLAPPAISGRTRLYAILGDPIAQVKSPGDFNRLFAERRQDAVLLPMHVGRDHVDDVLQALSNVRNLDGIVLTVPHKFSGLRHCAQLSERAQLLQAVNVMRRTSDHGWCGDMLDGLGYVAALREKGCALEGRSVLLVGSGGAGTAIAEALVRNGIARLAVTDQDGRRQSNLIAMLRQLGLAKIDNGNTDPTGFDIIINATPCGMASGDLLPIDTNRLVSSMFVGDVITSPPITPLLRVAGKFGCKTLTGAEMFSKVLTLMDRFFDGDDYMTARATTQGATYASSTFQENDPT